ncbi:putative prenyltransferase [Diaporthe sp. PMI_573]|nr:putative prenyltransferase [Diaporthaceae sp. PMI_573]
MSGKASSRPQQQSSSENAALAQQYGGHHTGAWVSMMPPSWVPYVQLARLSPPAGVFLIYFPHLFGAVLGGIVTRAPLLATCRACFLLLIGSFFLSNAAHAWNDIVDEPFDRAVGRTRQRPIPRGAISRYSALLFAASQAVGAFAILWTCFPAGAVWYAAPNIVFIIYYPWAKRHTHLAQFVLGICLAWGVFIGLVALNHQPFTYRQLRLADPQDVSTMWELPTEWGAVLVDTGAVSLFLACVLWTVICDSIYAHQDVMDDIKLGLKSTAVLFQGYIKPFLGLLLSAMLALLFSCGNHFDFELPYYLFSMMGSCVVLGAMALQVDLDNSANCWWWFKHAFWAVGCSIFLGLLSQYPPEMMYVL